MNSLRLNTALLLCPFRHVTEDRGHIASTSKAAVSTRVSTKMILRSCWWTSFGGQPVRVVELVLERLGFWRDSAGSGSMASRGGCLRHGLEVRVESECLAWQKDSHVVDCEELVEAEEESEACEATDETDADDEDADAASVAPYGAASWWVVCKGESSLITHFILHRGGLRGTRGEIQTD
jgi:hypothetical protein